MSCEPNHATSGVAMVVMSMPEATDCHVACHHGVSRQVGVGRGRGMSIVPPCWIQLCSCLQVGGRNSLLILWRVVTNECSEVGLGVRFWRALRANETFAADCDEDTHGGSEPAGAYTGRGLI